MADEVNVLLARVDERLRALEARVVGMESLVRWLALAIGGALVTAILNLLLRG